MGGGGEVWGSGEGSGRSGKWSRALSHGQKYQALNWDTHRETGLVLGRLWQKTSGRRQRRFSLGLGWSVQSVHFNLGFFLWPGVSQLLCIRRNASRRTCDPVGGM